MANTLDVYANGCNPMFIWNSSMYSPKENDTVLVKVANYLTLQLLVMKVNSSFYINVISPIYSSKTVNMSGFSVNLKNFH